MMMDQLQTVFDAGTAIRDLGEIVFPEHLLILETEWAMIGGDHLQVIVFQTVPQLRQVLFGPQRQFLVSRVRG